MPSDAMTALACLAGQLGRAPSLLELYRYLGVEPSGTVLPRPEAPPTDAEVTGMLRLREAEGASTEILAARRELLRELLFGDLGGPPGIHLPPSRRPSGHVLPGPSPLGP